MSAQRVSICLRGRFGLRRVVGRDDQSGLSAPEWLLIVAAVAGLAALAVTLVAGSVEDTAEQIRTRRTEIDAARMAALEITTRARSARTGAPRAPSSYDDDRFAGMCRRLAITHGSAGVVAQWVGDGKPLPSVTIVPAEEYDRQPPEAAPTCVIAATP
ncbi:MAG: hypothetical protein F4121_00405 [Acidimicrobiia bacterium]|nr:hypothetical protein [Acidimicrobiia bacterium]MYC45375.1 hypothetical protein [Acidimicrobiia bacterium]MYI18586.1 hypothetical protein [Acidimicrobiia bacterium]